LIDNSHSIGEAEPYRVESDILSPIRGRSVVSLAQADDQELNDQLNSGPAQQLQSIISPEEQPGPEIDEPPPMSPAAPMADMEIPEGDLADDELPAPEELPAAVASAKKRGRPAATPGKTPASSKAKTPRTNGHATASRTTTGRKRKAEDDVPEAEATPVKRPRGRPARSAAATASARLAAKSAKKAKPGRPKGGAAAVRLSV